MIERALVMTALLCCASCTTILNGTTTTIKVESDAPGERVWIDGIAYRTPVELELWSFRPHVVHGPDFRSYEILPVSSDATELRAVLVALLPISFLAVVIDKATGADWTLSPSTIHVSPPPAR